MPVVINDFEVAPAPAAQQPAGASQAQGQAQPDAAKKIQKAFQLQHERKRRLAEY